MLHIVSHPDWLRAFLPAGLPDLPQEVLLRLQLRRPAGDQRKLNHVPGTLNSYFTAQQRFHTKDIL